MNHFVENNLEILEGKKSTVKAIETLIDERIEAVVNLNFTKESYTSMMSHAYSTQNSQFRDQLLAAIDKSNEAMLELLTELKKSGKINAKLKISELVEFIDFSWRGARLKSRILKSKEPLDIFKKYLVAFILKS
jgi:ABC-type enterochelin transport system ATPase subunit